MLSVENLHVSYGAIKALHGVSLEVPEGSIVTLIGANGAGKSTTLRALSGLVKSTGSIRYQGKEISKLSPNKIVAGGLCHVPEGRMVFANLTVHENLMMGAYARTDRTALRSEISHVHDLFPILSERADLAAGSLSGGEQMMLAIGRALLADPVLLMLDEPSLGLAPQYIERIFDVIEKLRDDGVTILLIEQNAAMALETADRGYVLEDGRIALAGTGAELANNPEVRRAYLGEME